MWYNGDMVLQAKKKFGLPQLAAVTNKSIKSAGEHRLLMDREFPNMPIKKFDNAVKGLIGGGEFRALVSDVTKNIQRKWDDVANRPWSKEYLDKLPRPETVMRGLNSLAETLPGDSGGAIATIYEHAEFAYRQTASVADKMDRDDEDSYSKWEPVLQYGNSFLHTTRFLGKDMGDAGRKPYMHANACRLHETGALILHGEWGMGKTHSLCSLAKMRQEQKCPALLVLARELGLGESPGEEIARRVRTNNFSELLCGLNALGRQQRERALLLVDGINEKNSDVWTEKLGVFLRQVLEYPFVGVIVSCRDPFHLQLPKDVLSERHLLRHSGFEDKPLQAQEKFLRHYGFSMTDFPPMLEEAARPLMLNIICEGFYNMPENDVRKGFGGVKSEQKGMTKILEHYIKGRAKATLGIHKQFPVWELVKDKIAPYMAENLTEEIPVKNLLKFILEVTGDLPQARKILRAMEAGGIVTISRTWPIHNNASHLVAGKKPQRRLVARMPYQRLNDHLIARHLLDKEIKKDNKSIAELRRSFHSDNLLGKIFTMEHGAFRYLDTGTGLPEALIMEFPERVKRTPYSKELLFYLPHWRQKIDAYRAPFLRGLYWRKNDAITDQTMRLAEGYLDWEEQTYAESPFRIGETAIFHLLSLACKDNSPLSAGWLAQRMRRMEMTCRDVKWGASVLGARVDDWADILFSGLAYLKENKHENVSSKSAHNYILLLSLFLGTTDHPLRDRATEALVALGEDFPELLFNRTLCVLDFDDIYYPERMLAACYSVAMSQWDIPDAKEFHRKFPEFARRVVRDVFMPGGRLLTHHSLVRDYALGIAGVARKLGVQFFRNEERYMSLPFSAVPPLFPSPVDIDDKEFDKASWAFSFAPDFHDRYTVPYISPRGEFPNISRQIKWRVMNLGYTNEKFSTTDIAINQNHSRREEVNYGKVDRCGKKYSWIAYHEMCGHLDSNGQLQRHIRETENVIDPSFPIPPSKWTQEFKVPSMDGSEVQWYAKAAAPEYGHILELKSLDDLPGPWVMLEGDAIHRKAGSENLGWGFSHQGNKHLRRDVYSFLRGLLVQESDIPRLQSALRDSEYPGDSDISRCISKSNVFGGEIPWSPNFTSPDPDEENQSAFGIPVQTTAVCHRGNMYHGERFMFSEAWYPIADICVKLGLSRRGRGVDLVDKNGNPASLYRADDGHLTPNPFEGQRDDYQFLYLRKDLLDEYLRVTGKRLVWIIWGERRLLHDSEDTPEMLAARRGHKNVHKKLCVYPLQSGGA